MKRMVSFLLALILIFPMFSGCTASEEEELIFEEKAGDIKEHFGDKESRKSLDICVDAGISIEVTDDTLISMMKELTNEIKSVIGIEEVSIECIPMEGAERDTALNRLKTEIMAGAGPDVFIMCTANRHNRHANTPSALFNFPQKNMEAGLFLPLDEYMENNTRFTDWGKQNKTILDAGRTDEGQVVVPLTYTLPIFVYPKNEMNLTLSSSLTMQDFLNDLNNSSIDTVLYSAYERDFDDAETYTINSHHLAYALGQLADYKNEELLFTEDEFLNTVDMMTALYEQVDDIEFQYIAEEVGYGLFHEMALVNYDTEMSLVPIYSVDGGVTASVSSFAAVNRNTKFPEESFTVIDYLMQERVQSGSKIYRFLLDDGIPLQDDLCQEEKPISASVDPQRYFSAAHYEEFSEIKKQITAVNFRSELDLILEEILETTATEYFTTGECNLEGIPETYAQMKRMVGE